MRRSQRSGDWGGSWRPNTSPQTQIRAWDGSWACTLDLQGRYRGGMYSIVDLFQITVHCTEAAGRRWTRDTISALHAADACRLPALRH